MNMSQTTTRTDWSFAAAPLAFAAGICPLPIAARADVLTGLPTLLAAPAAERGVAR